MEVSHQYLGFDPGDFYVLLRFFSSETADFFESFVRESEEERRLPTQDGENGSILF